MNVAEFNSNTGQTANVIFTLSGVLDRQNQFPSILLSELIVFKIVKEQTCYMLFHYGQLPFLIPLWHLGLYNMKEIKTQVKNQLFATKETNREGLKKGVEGEKKPSLQRDQKINWWLQQFPLDI